MSFLLTSTALSFKRLVRRPSTIFIAGLLLIACLGGALFYAGEQQVLEIRVGVLAEPEDPFAEEVFSRLISYDSPIEFEQYPLSERDAIEREVIVGELECAYLLEPGLRERIVKGRARGSIELLYSPRSVVNTLSSEMVFAAVLGAKVEDMAAELIEETLDCAPEEAARIAAEQVAYYEEQSVYLAPEFHYITAGGGEEEVSVLAAGSRLLHGIIALLLLGGTLWAIPPLIRETPGITGAMPSSVARVYQFGVAAAVALTQLATGLLSLAAIALVYPDALGNPLSEIGWLLIYAASLGLGGVAVSRLLHKDNIVYGGGIFAMILTALLGGVMIDLAEIGPLFETIGRLFVTAGYITGAMGTGGFSDAAALLVLMVLSLAVIAAPAKARK